MRKNNTSVRTTESDIISKSFPQYNRGRVKLEVMKEIGYEDCDYISIESSWKSWKNVFPFFEQQSMWPAMELHVPCREPLSHLMSQCNHRNVEFDCESPSLEEEVKNCLVLIQARFNKQGLTHIPNATLKCFNPIPIDTYLEYMSSLLQRKRFEVDYVPRASNRPRNKTNECIWKNSTVADRVLEILYRYDYYSWCLECLGSENDLLAN